MNHFALAAIALLIESFSGYPAALQKAIGHPVEWIGKLISYLDEGLNDQEAPHEENRRNGILALGILLAVATLPAIVIGWLLNKFSFGWMLNIALAIPFLAQKSLVDHLKDIITALGHSLPAARASVAKIVGRDTDTMQEPDIIKASLESLAENTSDGIVAPALWFAILGLPGLVAYKAINTADSMIGHKSEKYLYFGWAAARLDDLVNLPASRLTAGLFTLAAYANGKQAMMNAWTSVWRDAAKHNSPNAGWPEAAMAGGLGLKFGGKRNYQGEIIDLPTMGDGRTPHNIADLNEGLILFRNAMGLLTVLAILLAIAL